jgi:signal transduction histidine kinase
VDYFSRLSRQIRLYAFLLMAAIAVLVAGGLWVIYYSAPGLLPVAYAIIPLSAIVLALWFADWLAKLALKPLRLIWQAILHVSPEHTGTPAPNLERIGMGRELVSRLVMQIYQLASSAGAQIDLPNKTDAMALTIAKSFPLPIFVISADASILFANEAALHYINQPVGNVIGNNLRSIVNMTFSSERTLVGWLAESRAHKATASNSWYRVKMKLADQKTVKQCDMAAHYSKSDSNSAETILTLFDKTEEYSQDDDGLGFVALAVHELRTPLTMLRGFIEVFEDEVGDQLDDEMRSFLYKMQASAQQLATFVNNILNVARVEENQLELQLAEENWPELVRGVLNDLALRVQVYGKVVEFTSEPDLPTVAVDKVSIYEVIANLIDNAMKYSGNSTKILVHSRRSQDGLVETTVEDFGVGIPSSVMPHLFEKFQRSHRNRAQIGGTGLGLYLSRAIVAAHGGHIWVQSKEGEGSEFSFTVKPYRLLADELKNNDNKDITRGAHGWIKNHSLNRR